MNGIAVSVANLWDCARELSRRGETAPPHHRAMWLESKTPAGPTGGRNPDARNQPQK
jgi:hypothetical protein